MKCYGCKTKLDFLRIFAIGKKVICKECVPAYKLFPAKKDIYVLEVYTRTAVYRYLVHIDKCD